MEINENSTTDEILAYQVEKEKELLTAQDDLQVLIDAKHQLDRAKIELDLKRNTLINSISKGRHNINSLKLEISILTKQYWKARN